MSTTETVTVSKTILLDLIMNAELGIGTGSGRMAEFVNKQCAALRAEMDESIDYDAIEPLFDFDTPVDEEVILEGSNVVHVNFGG